MPLYEKKWWKKLFQREEAATKIDVLNDLDAVKEFLADVPMEIKKLLPELQKWEELEKERKVAKAGILQVNLETQAEVLDAVLKRYASMQNDFDINGLRMKEIIEQFLNHAQKAGLKDLVKEKQQDLYWQGKW